MGWDGTGFDFEIIAGNRLVPVLRFAGTGVCKTGHMQDSLLRVGRPIPKCQYLPMLRLVFIDFIDRRQ